MTIFDELRSAYRLSQDTYRAYARGSMLAVRRLAREFHAYLGAPATYADPEDETRRPYVRLLSFQIRDGTPIAVPPDPQTDLLIREPDGFWRFAISLTLDRDSDVFPKQNLAFFLRIKPRGETWDVQLLDEGFQGFRIAPGSPADMLPLFDHMVAMVKRLLAAKPWDGVEKLPIGFELHRPRPIIDDEPPDPLIQP
ncbi:MAG: hypothetical protein AB7H90_00265 [Alphaproteobacteria bacterium]